MRDLTETDPPERLPNATKAYRVRVDGQEIGVVALVLADRPNGITKRHDWWVIASYPSSNRFDRAFSTKDTAVGALRFWHQRDTKPPPPKPIDPTLRTIELSYDTAGPAAALWMASTVAVHHARELEQNRHTNPTAFWHELRRIITWLETAMGGKDAPSNQEVAHYRRSITNDGEERPALDR